MTPLVTPSRSLTRYVNHSSALTSPRSPPTHQHAVRSMSPPLARAVLPRSSSRSALLCMRQCLHMGHTLVTPVCGHTLVVTRRVRLPARSRSMRTAAPAVLAHGSHARDTGQWPHARGYTYHTCVSHVCDAARRRTSAPAAARSRSRTAHVRVAARPNALLPRHTSVWPR